jgi:hypothetical protein
MSNVPKQRQRNVIDIRPRFGRIRTAQTYSGIGRSRLYQLAAVTPGLFRKNGAATVVDLDVLDKILDMLPRAEIKAPSADRPCETEVRRRALPESRKSMA